MKDFDVMTDVFARHERIAFQFSGGRDSTAALYLLRPFWHRMTVYHVDTGDQFPETKAVVNAVARDVALVRILSSVHEVHDEHGYPSDLVPVDNTDLGRSLTGKAVKLQSRFECCIRTLMQPMHNRMVHDGITLLVRGQRDEEFASPPMRSGDVGDGFELFYPIQNWSADQVMGYLIANDLPVAPFYEFGMRSAPECMGCTAWWDEGRAAYLRARHPDAHSTFVRRIQIVRAEINKQAGALAIEMESCNV